MSSWIGSHLINEINILSFFMVKDICSLTNFLSKVVFNVNSIKEGAHE